jgi:hypothetical protein
MVFESRPCESSLANFCASALLQASPSVFFRNKMVDFYSCQECKSLDFSLMQRWDSAFQNLQHQKNVCELVDQIDR